MKSDPLKIRIGKALREIRRQRLIDGTELAGRLGKQSSQIYRWERGEAAAGIDQVYRYLEAVGASFVDLDRELGLNERPASNKRLREIAKELEKLSRLSAERRSAGPKRRR